MEKRRTNFHRVTYTRSMYLEFRTHVTNKYSLFLRCKKEENIPILITIVKCYVTNNF